MSLNGPIYLLEDIPDAESRSKQALLWKIIINLPRLHTKIFPDIFAVKFLFIVEFAFSLFSRRSVSNSPGIVRLNLRTAPFVLFVSSDAQYHGRWV